MASTITRSAGRTTEEFTVTALAATAAVALEGGYVSSTELIVQQNITAISGTTPKITSKLEDSIDGTNWNVIKEFSESTTEGVKCIRISRSEPFNALKLRINNVVGGTTPKVTAKFHIHGIPLA